MANTNTDTASQQTDGLSRSTEIVKDGSVVTGDVLHAHALYTVTGSEDVADTIRIVQLQSGTWVLPELCGIVHEALGTALTVTIGDETDPDRFSAALDVKAAGANTAFAGGVESLTPVKLTVPTWITATVTVATTPTADQVAKFNVAYKAIS